MVTREIGWNNGMTPEQMMFISILLGIIIITISTIVVRNRILAWNIEKNKNGFNEIKKKIFSLGVDGLFQKLFFKKPVFRLMQLFLLCGFGILFIGTSIIFIQEYLFGPVFGIHFFSGNFYIVFSFAMEIAGLLALLSVIVLGFRIFIQKSEYNENRLEDFLVGSLFFGVLITGFFMEATRIAINAPEFEKWSFVGWYMSKLLPASASLHTGLWWTHLTMSACFLGVLLHTRFARIIFKWVGKFFLETNDIGSEFQSEKTITSKDKSKQKNNEIEN